MKVWIKPFQRFAGQGQRSPRRSSQRAKLFRRFDLRSKYVLLCGYSDKKERKKFAQRNPKQIKGENPTCGFLPLFRLRRKIHPLSGAY
ncbi:MAG: hypothetical protein IJW70_05700 [Clostridia bacterium]|nr:hypothetical protein [Clostridia bacterium]